MEMLAFTDVSWVQRFRSPCASNARFSQSFIGTLYFYKLEEVSAESHCRYARLGNEFPNIGFPLLDCS